MDRGNGSCCGCGLRGDSYSRGGVEKAEGAFYMVRVGRTCGSAFYERPLATLENCGRPACVSRSSALRSSTRGDDGLA